MAKICRSIYYGQEFRSEKILKEQTIKVYKEAK